jgi:RNA polymerase sigma-70 factor, ECF subfamily
MNQFSVDHEELESSSDSISKNSNRDAPLQRIKPRDEQAFETIVRFHGGRIQATARRLLGDEHDANDVVQ